VDAACFGFLGGIQGSEECVGAGVADDVVVRARAVFVADRAVIMAGMLEVGT
jgi:hypothetical protein